MSGSFSRLSFTVLGIIAVLLAAPAARAQKEFPPPQGKGRLVVVASGASGPGHYEAVTAEIAKLGYDAVLFDGNSMEGTHGAAVKASILQAQQFPHALPGKVALVGFSLGGGEDLFFGTQLPDEVAIVIVWYPLTRVIRDIPTFASKLKVPVLMFAGELDSYRNCCAIDTARSLAAATSGRTPPFELVTYPNTKHDFVYGGENYNQQSYTDAFQRTAAKLKTYLGQ
jgi:dienelactone hydrolase